MRNTEKTADLAAAKLPAELSEFLLLVEKSGYKPAKLHSLLLDFKLIGEEEYSNDLLNCVGLILSNSEDLNTEEIISTHRCFELARTLLALKK